jgi:HSP20 family protein
MSTRMNLVPWLARENAEDPFEMFFRPMQIFNKDIVTNPQQELSLRRMNKAMSMKTDVQETDKEVIFHCEAVGVPKEKIDIAVKDGVLTIKGEQKNLRESDEGDWHRTERTFGSFERSFKLPDTVDTNSDVTAGMENGVLTLHFPKLKEQKSKRVKKIVIE